MLRAGIASVARSYREGSGTRAMLPTTELAIIHNAEHFRHPDAARIFQSVLGLTGVKIVIIDLTQVRDATTAAFAHLVLLRRKLLRNGRDLRLKGLREPRAVSLLQSIAYNTRLIQPTKETTMPTRSASAVWEGDLKQGKGNIKLGSGAWQGSYSF